MESFPRRNRLPSHVKRLILHPSPKGGYISHGYLPYWQHRHRTNTHRRAQTTLPQVLGPIRPLTTSSRDPPVPDTRDPPVSCTTSEGVNHYNYASNRNPSVPDTRDPPVSCTTSEGVKHYSYAISGPRTQSLLHLLSHSHVHIRQRGNRHPYATTGFPHPTILYHVLRRRRTTWLRRRQFSANIPHSTRETTHSPHIYTTHGVCVPRQ